MGEQNTSALDHLRDIQSLRNFLQSETSINDTENGKVVVKIKVCNDAPESLDGGDVVFLGVGLSIVYDSRYDSRKGRMSAFKKMMPSDIEKLHNKELHKKYSQRTWLGDGGIFPVVTANEASLGDTLFPGDNVTYELTTTKADLPYLDIRVEGSLSRRHLLHISQPMADIKTLAQPIIVETFRALDAIDFYSPLFSIKGVMPAFGPQTTLADIDAFKVAIEKVRDHIEQNVKDFGQLRDLAPDQKVRDYIRYTFGEDLLAHARKILSRTLEAITGSNIEMMKQSAEEINALLLKAEDVKRRQADLMSEFGIGSK